MQDLKQVIKSLKEHTAPGEDRIHNLLIKNIPDDFLETVLNLINESYLHGILPKSWKSSLVTMIPMKVAYSPNSQDYSPISLLLVTYAS